MPTLAHEVAPLIDPFDGEALLLVPAGDDTRRDTLASVLAGLGLHALLFHGREGEAYPDPLQRPAMILFDAGMQTTLFDGHAAPAAAGATRGCALPGHSDAKSTAAWIDKALAGRQLMPLPIMLAHKLARQLAEVRRAGTVPWLRPDGKTQVSVLYEDGRPRRVTDVLVSTQHAEGIARYFAGPLTQHDIGELSKILADLIRANENQPS